MTGPMISVGANDKVVKALDRAILAIIKSNNGEQVKIAALHTLQQGVSVNGTSITSCTFTAK